MISLLIDCKNEWPRMTLNGYFMSKSVFMPAVLLRAFEDRRTQSATKMKANVVPKSIRSVRIFAWVPYTGALNVSVVLRCSALSFEISDSKSSCCYTVIRYNCIITWALEKLYLYAVSRRIFSDPIMRDLERKLNVTEGVLCWCWRQMLPHRQGCRV